MVFSGNGLVSTFLHHKFQYFFLTKHAILTFLLFSPDPRARKDPKGFDNKLLKTFYWPWNSFSTF